MTRRGKILFGALIFAGVVAVGATRMLSPPATSSVAPFDWRSDWGLEEEFSLSIDTEGYQYPSAIAFVPEPGADPKDPLYFVTELRGTVKVVTNDRSVYTFAEGFFTPTSPGDFPAPEGQRGLAGICLEPQHGYIFVTFTYQDEQGVLRNSIVRFDSRPGTFSLRAESYRTLTEIFSAYESAPPYQIGPCQISDGLLYVSVGDGRQTIRSQSIDTLVGKILRMTLDGMPVPTNPFYQGTGPNRASSYVWAYGLRNPFGLKVLDGRVFIADNGVNIDRFLEARAGENFRWSGTDLSLGANAAMIFAPAIGPAQLEYCPSALCMLPEGYQERFFVASSAPQSAGVLALHYDLTAREMLGIPKHLMRYRGRGWQIVTGVALGSDGLYVVPMLPNSEGRSAVLRITHDPSQRHPYGLVTPNLEPEVLLHQKGCLGCHTLGSLGGKVAPPLDRGPMVDAIDRRLNSEEYAEAMRALNRLESEPFVSFRAAREEVLRASGTERVRTWVKNRILEPRFDDPYAQMPNLGLTDGEAIAITDYLVGEGTGASDVGEAVLRRVFPPRPGRRHLLYFFAGGALAGASLLGLAWIIGRRWATSRRVRDPEGASSCKGPDSGVRSRGRHARAR